MESIAKRLALGLVLATVLLVGMATVGAVEANAAEAHHGKIYRWAHTHWQQDTNDRYTVLYHHARTLGHDRVMKVMRIVAHEGCGNKLVAEDFSCVPRSFNNQQAGEGVQLDRSGPGTTCIFPDGRHEHLISENALVRDCLPGVDR